MNTLGEDHENTLISMIVSRDPALVSFLLQHGALVSPTAIELAAGLDGIDTFRLLTAAKPLGFRSAEAGRLLLLAAGIADTQLIRDLLERGAPVDYRQPQTLETPLLRAAAGERVDNARLLIKHGADANAQDYTGRTALMQASELCRYWDLKALLTHGADPAIRNRYGRTALEIDSAAANSPNSRTLSHASESYEENR